MYTWKNSGTAFDDVELLGPTLTNVNSDLSLDNIQCTQQAGRRIVQLNINNYNDPVTILLEGKYDYMNYKTVDKKRFNSVNVDSERQIALIDDEPWQHNYYRLSLFDKNPT